MDIKDIKKLTRMQAERLVAQTSDEMLLKQLAGHANEHVETKVRFKLASPEDRLRATVCKHLAALLVRLSTGVIA